jgi:hypothetical protein
MDLALVFLLALLSTFGIASPIIRRDGAPTVTLDQGTVTGTSDEGVEKFLGIPYAVPP